MKTSLIHYIFLFTCLLPSISSATELTGLEIMQAQQKANTGYQSEFLSGKFITTEKNKSVTERGFELYQAEANSSSPAKTLLKVTSPEDLKGTKLLSLGNNAQWLCLPSMGKIRRLPVASQNGLFLGTEFTNEDLSPKNIAQYDYKLLKTETCDNTTCHVIEATPVNVKSSYLKTISWITVDDYITKKTEFYGNNGNLMKTATFKQYVRLESRFWRPLEITITNVQTTRFTTMQIVNHTLGKIFPDSTFKIEALNR